MLLYAGALPDLYAINIVRIGSATESVHGGGVVFREACGNKRFIRCVLPPGIPGGDNDNAEHTTGSDFQDQLHLKGSPWRAGGRGHVCTTSLIPVLVKVSLISRSGPPPGPQTDRRPHGGTAGKPRRICLSLPARAAGARQTPQRRRQGDRSARLCGRCLSVPAKLCATG